MKRNIWISTVMVVTVFVCLTPVVGQEKHQHDQSGEIGRVNFPVSCNPKAQEQFNRAVAWLHSFEYEDAEKVFTAVTVADPKCAMGYWGVAMSNYHPLWAPPSNAELKKGRDALEKVKALEVRTEREKDYIDAAAAFFKDFEKVDHRTRAAAYGVAMEKFYLKHPSDREAGIFYALTLIAKGMTAGDKSYPNEKKAAEILNGVLQHEPQHPGVTHYLIHGFDYPALAYLALPAARSYAKIAPASAHARHMPSHIFTRMGMWEEAINSNLGARDAARAYAMRNKMPGSWDEELHAMDYLAYAYLQSAQDNKAREVLEDLYKIRKAEPQNFKIAYSFTAIPARYALERQQWSEAVKLPLQPGTMEAFPWPEFRWAEAHIRFARAIGAAGTRNVSTAREEIEQLGLIQRTLADKGGYDWAKQVNIARQVASAWLAQTEGQNEESTKLMRSAADLDDATEKHPVTPGSILPAREQLGFLLLELKRPSEALVEFEKSLVSAPNRFNGVYGAARASAQAGDESKARNYFTRLLELAKAGDRTRPELEEARTFLSRANKSAAKQ